MPCLHAMQASPLINAGCLSHSVQALIRSTRFRSTRFRTCFPKSFSIRSPLQGRRVSHDRELDQLARNCFYPVPQNGSSLAQEPSLSGIRWIDGARSGCSRFPLREPCTCTPRGSLSTELNLACGSCERRWKSGAPRVRLEQPCVDEMPQGLLVRHGRRCQ